MKAYSILGPVLKNLSLKMIGTNTESRLKKEKSIVKTTML